MPPRLGALLVFWGVLLVATKAMVREISPIPLIFTRAGLGTALPVATLALRRQSALPPRDDFAELAIMIDGDAIHRTSQPGRFESHGVNHAFTSS